MDIKHVIGQLDRVEMMSEELMQEDRLAEDEFQEICDCTATIITHLRVAFKRKIKNESVQKDD